MTLIQDPVQTVSLDQSLAAEAAAVRENSRNMTRLNTRVRLVWKRTWMSILTIVTLTMAAIMQGKGREWMISER